MDLTGYSENQIMAAGQANTYKAMHQPNVTERLEMQIADAEEKLSRLKSAYDELKKYPDIERLLNLLQRV